MIEHATGCSMHRDKDDASVKVCNCGAFSFTTAQPMSFVPDPIVMAANGREIGKHYKCGCLWEAAGKGSRWYPCAVHDSDFEDFVTGVK